MSANKILIIDDDMKYISQLLEILKEYDLKVGFSVNAPEALNILNSTSYDLIILDINMPIMNGFEVLEELKNSKTTRLIPVLMSSSESDKESVLKAIKLGADDYLLKPIDQNALLDKVSTLLQIRDFVLRWGLLPDITKKSKRN